MFYKRLLGFILSGSCSFVLPAQNTTGGITGTIQSNTGEALPGATVVLIHGPTGSSYFTQSRKKGMFNILNIEPGGPYTMEVSFVNFVTEKRSGIYLQLGEPLIIDLALVPRSSYLGNITVTGYRGREKYTVYGMETRLDRNKIDLLPSVGRDMHDYLRAVPQAKLLAGNEGAISFAGQNNRFNSFYVDGAVNNDVFGLAASGTNGGQAGISPLSMDAVNQFQVSLAPSDASLGNFTGAAINAVTRSGTNQAEGSVYYFFSNAFLAGKTPTGAAEDAKRADGFFMQTLGTRLQGAITRNKVFYFINMELQRNAHPQAFDLRGYLGDTRNPQAMKILSNALQTDHQYEAGNFPGNTETVNANRMVARFDWNANTHHKLSLSYRYTDGMRIHTNQSTPDIIHFSNDGYLLTTTTHSVSFELKSITGETSGNRLLVTYTHIKDNRDPLGKPFPRVRINDGNGAFVFGTDNSSTINLLTQDNCSVLDKYTFPVGNHLLDLGTDCEYSRVFNAFIQNSFGNYTYASLADFLTNDKPSYYQLGVPLHDHVNSDQTTAAAQLSVLKTALFVNDKIRLSQYLSFYAGWRLDQYLFFTSPSVDVYTNQVAIPQFEQYRDLEGARSGIRTKVPLSVSPRLGFNYNPGGKNITVSGGIGVFAGRIPLAWPGGSYQDNGNYTAAFTATNKQLNTIRFRNDPYRQWKPEELGGNFNNTSLDLIAARFSMPKTGRGWLALNRDMGNGWSCMIESMYSKDLNEIHYINSNLVPPAMHASGPDNRLVYSIANNGRIPLNTDGSNPFGYAILLTNNKDRTGYTYDHTVTFIKRTKTGFVMECNYNFCRSVALNDGTSSVNFSQWRFMETVNGRNDITVSTSDFSTAHRIFLLVSKQFRGITKKSNTTLSLVYTGESGSPLSYVYGNASMTRDDGPSGGNDLIYVPTSADLAGMQFLPFTTGNTVYPSQLQKDALEKYITGDAYLQTRRGRYAERNGSRTPFTHIVDLKLKKQFNLTLAAKNYLLEITCNLFNAGNLLNRSWGRRYLQPNDNFALVDFAGYTSETNLKPQYHFDPAKLSGTPWQVTGSLSPAYTARWISEMGIRVTFN